MASHSQSLNAVSVLDVGLSNRRCLTLIDSSLITYDVDCLFKCFPVISLSSGWCLFRLFVHLLSRIVIFGF